MTDEDYVRRVLHTKRLKQMVKSCQRTDQVDILNFKFQIIPNRNTSKASSLVMTMNLEASVGGYDKKFDWVVKIPHRESKKVAITKALRADFKEVKFYAFIMHYFIEEELKRGDHDIQLKFCPIHYSEWHEDPHEHYVVAMENLKHFGFAEATPLSEEKDHALNVDHLRLVMTALAEFHAVSHVCFAQKLNGKGAFDDKEFASLARDYVYAEKPKELKEFYQKYFDLEQTIQSIVLKESQDPDDRVFIKAYEDFFKNQGVTKTKMLEKLAKTNKEEFNVLCHGDLWFYNMFFLYEEEDPNVPKDVCFLDMASIKWANPCLDLVYFVYTSITPEQRQAHLEELLKLYHDTLINTVSNMTVVKGAIYSYEQFQTDFKKYSLFGFMVSLQKLSALIIHPFDFLSIDELEQIEAEHNYDDVKKVKESIKTHAKEALDKEPHIRSMIKGNFLEMFENGFF